MDLSENNKNKGKEGKQWKCGGGIKIFTFYD